MTAKNDVKIQAEIDKAWTEAKIKNYQEDGAPVPAAIERLHALSVLVCNDPGLAPASGADDMAWRDATGCDTPEQALGTLVKAMQSAGEIDEWRKATGCDTPALAAKGIANLDAMAKASGDTLAILRDGALWFAQSAANLSRSSLAVELSHLVGSASASYKAPPVVGGTKISAIREGGHAEAPVGPGATFQDAREGHPPAKVEMAPAPTVERKGIVFRHGLVLVKRDAPNHRVLFSNTRGPWVAQTITATGDLGPETAAHEGIWFTDTWEEGPAYVAPAEPKKGEQTITPGSGPTVPPEPAKQPTVADWNPDDKAIAGFVKSFGEKVAAEGKPMTVDDQLVRGLVVRFKKEKGTMVNQKPGVSFFHYGMAALRG